MTQACSTVDTRNVIAVVIELSKEDPLRCNGHSTKDEHQPQPEDGEHKTGHAPDERLSERMFLQVGSAQCNAMVKFF